ncbi:hypothetical protein NBRC10512_006721 [Rhodotorula toruloides]|uniref:RHTO0S30e00628g1_1 n=2 Tax=Rhodotorula toruloides TaxID=5286 RepID=A0A061BNX2_RHOTO|nr:uncharacterized protein RHTO_00016 [Rhodotorula toruloides NP11]EMS25588.1 hypothetical protein RHTO_00016 [Rhodotorula toruloides NP11]CDR49704.1 RHTO0S30e00628g1_1 [Rhodotorula toruloides]
MPSTLPIEIQLRIIDLALPPRTSANFPARRDLLLACSLVHRSWTAHARGLLEEQARFNVEQWTGHHDAAMLFRRTHPARRLKRLDIRIAHRLGGLEEDLAEGLKEQMEAIEELSFARSADLCPACDYKLLYETNDWHAHNAVPSLRFLSSGAFPFLRFLSISHMILPPDWHDAAMPTLHTLLLNDVGPRSVFSNLGSLKSLRVLGAKADFGHLFSCLEGTWPAVEHLAVVGISVRSYDDLVTDDSLPDSLSSITVLHLPTAMDMTAWPDRRDSLNAQLGVRCAQLSRRECVKFAEISGFDLEEWALSVTGA